MPLLIVLNQGEAPPVSEDVRIVTLTNVGTDEVTIGVVALSEDTDTAFTIAIDTASNHVLGVGESATVGILFEPGAEGDFTGELRVPSSDPDGVLLVALLGTRLPTPAPIIAVDPLTWDAGDVLTAGGSESTTITVTNTGTGDMTVGTIAITGSGFAKSDDEATGQIIAPGESRTLTVTFDPGSNGVASGSLTIPSDGGEDVVVTLAGTGVADPPPVEVDPIPVSRFYLGRQAAPAGVTVINSSWNRHTVDADNALTIAKGGPPAAWGTTTNLSIGQRTRLARWIGPPMAAQEWPLVFTAICTAAYRSSALGAQVTSALRFGVWRAATSTVEQQAILSHSTVVEAWPTAENPLPRRMPAGISFVWEVELVLEEGDRLVIEAGARGTGSASATAGVRMRWGGESTAADVVNNIGDAQPSAAAWIEFSDALLVLP